jgi:hypothetical protein
MFLKSDVQTLLLTLYYFATTLLKKTRLFNCGKLTQKLINLEYEGRCKFWEKKKPKDSIVFRID